MKVVARRLSVWIIKAFIWIVALWFVGVLINFYLLVPQENLEESKIGSVEESGFLGWEEFLEEENGQSEMPKEEIALVPEPPRFPNEEQMKIIGRMADGIYKWKAKVKNGEETGRYYDCGKWYQGSDAKDRALLWAFHIVKASVEASELNRVTLNPWGVAGTIANESAFDLCSFGLYPRKTAYRTSVAGQPLLRQSKRTISHTYEEVVRAIKHPKLRKQFRTYDLGGLQVLAMYYSGPMEKLLTWEGFYWQVRWMARKQRLRKTETPWAYWPGRYSLKKHKKVVRHARKIGATLTDIKL